MASPLHYKQLLKDLSRPVITQNVSIGSSGYVIPLIPKQNSVGGLLPNRVFKTQYEGEVRFNFVGAANTKMNVSIRHDFIHHFTEVAGAPNTDQTDSRTLTYETDTNGVLTIAMSDFNSYVEVNSSSPGSNQINNVIPISANLVVDVFTEADPTVHLTGVSLAVTQNVRAVDFDDVGVLFEQDKNYLFGGDWNSTAVYQRGEYVVRGGEFYVLTATNSTGQDPMTNATIWRQTTQAGVAFGAVVRDVLWSSAAPGIDSNGSTGTTQALDESMSFDTDYDLLVFEGIRNATSGTSANGASGIAITREEFNRSTATNPKITWIDQQMAWVYRVSATEFGIVQNPTGHSGNWSSFRIYNVIGIRLARPVTPAVSTTDFHASDAAWGVDLNSFLPSADGEYRYSVINPTNAPNNTDFTGSIVVNVFKTGNNYRMTIVDDNAIWIRGGRNSYTTTWKDLSDTGIDNVQSDWNATSGAAQILNKPSVMSMQGEWAGQTYAENDVVYVGVLAARQYWLAKRAVTGGGTPTENDNWTLLNGMGGATVNPYRGAYANNTAYTAGQFVNHSNIEYIVVADVPDTNTTAPSDTNASFSRLTGSGGAAGAPGQPGAAGTNGYSPVIANEVDGERIVQRITDWTGGTGTKPATGYIGSGGALVSTAAAATNIRGATGSGGGGGGDTTKFTRTASVGDLNNFLPTAEEGIWSWGRTASNTPASGNFYVWCWAGVYEENSEVEDAHQKVIIAATGATYTRHYDLVGGNGVWSAWRQTYAGYIATADDLSGAPLFNEENNTLSFPRKEGTPYPVDLSSLASGGGVGGFVVPLHSLANTYAINSVVIDGNGNLWRAKRAVAANAPLADGDNWQALYQVRTANLGSDAYSQANNPDEFAAIIRAIDAAMLALASSENESISILGTTYVLRDVDKLMRMRNYYNGRLLNALARGGNRKFSSLRVIG